MRAALAFFGAPLIVLVAMSVAIMFVANEDPFVRNALCRAGACFYSEAARGWNKLLYDFAAGCVITVMFFWLLVRWPELQKRKRIKKSFRTQYRTFKLACIENFLAVADGGFDATLPETLLPIEQFRAYFKQEVGGGTTRWDEVANKMTPYYLEATLSRMEILRQEISFVIYNTDISEGEAFELSKRLSQAMLMQRNATADYDFDLFVSRLLLAVVCRLGLGSGLSRPRLGGRDDRVDLGGRSLVGVWEFEVRLKIHDVAELKGYRRRRLRVVPHLELRCQEHYSPSSKTKAECGMGNLLRSDLVAALE